MGNNHGKTNNGKQRNSKQKTILQRSCKESIANTWCRCFDDQSYNYKGCPIRINLLRAWLLCHLC